MIGEHMKQRSFFEKLYMDMSRRDGSALVFTMIAVAVLAILGTVLVSMSIVNTRMKRSGIVVKKNIYYTESGIDQVYAKISDEVLKAISEADKEADKIFYNNLTKIDEILKYTVKEPVWGKDSDGHDIIIGYIDVIKPSEHPEYSSYSVYLDGSDDTGYTIKYDKLQDEATTKFNDTFKGEIRTAITPAFIEGAITKPVDPAGSRTAEIIAGKVSVSGFDSMDEDNFHVKNIFSRMKYKDDTVKVVHVDVNLKIPKKIYEISHNPKHYEIPDNPIWQQGLVADKDIDVRGDVDVLGNVFGLGVTGTDSFDPTTYGGVSVIGGGELTINGDLVSREYVQLAENASGNLTVNGLVHADTLISQKGSSGSIYVEKDVYTKDDLELNGDKSSILINGNYYGYTDDDKNNTSHDNSSAIVINATEPTASLIINGNGSGAYNGSIINGVSFIAKNTKYKTGESVSFRDNTFVYAYDFNTDLSYFTEDEDEDYNALEEMKTDTSGFLTDAGEHKFSVLSESEKTAALNGGFFSDPEFEKDAGETGTLKIADKEKEKKYKKAYFLAFQEYVDSEVSGLSRGDKEVKGPHVEIKKYLASTGVRLFENEFNLGENTGDNTNGAGFASNAKKEYPKDFAYYLHKLEPREGASFTADVDSADPIGAFTNSSAGEVNSINGNVIKCISNGDLSINGGDLDFPDGNFYTGVIFAKGDIYITGEMNFIGPVIAGGNIYFSPSSDVSIKNVMTEEEKKKLAVIIAEDENLYKLFDAGTTEIFDFDINRSQVKELSEFNKLQNYDKYIMLENWKVEEEREYYD